MIKHQDQCQLGEERVYFIFYIVVHPSEMSGQKLEAGTAAEAKAENAVYRLSQPVLLYYSGPFA